jgi:hypothetical protein
VVAGLEPAAEGSEPAKAAALDVVEAGTTEAAVAVATGEAPVHDAERAGADVTMKEVASVSGQEVALARGSRPQQDPLVEPAGTVEGGAVEPLTGALEEEAPAPEVLTVEARIPEPLSVEAPAPEAPAVEGARPHAPLDDILLDKGKQAMGSRGVRSRTRPVLRRPLERWIPRARPVLPWDRETPRPGHPRRGPTSPRWQ